MRVAFHLLTRPADNVYTSGGGKMQRVQKFVGRGIHDGDVHHFIVCIQ
jgi:hypothetical protein